MKSNSPLKAALVLACLAGVLTPLLRTAAPPDDSGPAKKVSGVHAERQRSLQTSGGVPVAVITDAEPLLPLPVLASEPSAVAPAAPMVAIPAFKSRPPEESMLSSWAARDPEGAGRWLNQNRNHPKFADMVRGYAIQIAATDPAAARQWAAVLDGKGNRFGLGGTLEQHIDAIEAMLKGPAAASDEISAAAILSGLKAGTLLQADYTPRLVRQNPGEPPVLEMQPTRPEV